MLTFQETAQFCEQMNMILSSGLSIGEGLEIMSEDIHNDVLKKAVYTMMSDISSGESFYHAAVSTGVFDNYFLEMVKIGERTGYLDKVMGQSAIYYERIGEMQNKVKDALFYPTILFAMMIVLMGILVIKILPIFRDVLNSLGIDITLNSLLLMNIGQIIAKVGLIVLVGVTIITVCSFGWFKVKYKQKAMSEFLSSFPLTKKLMVDIEVSKIAYALSLQINSGMKLSDSFEVLDELIDHKAVKSKIAMCIKKSNAGVDGVDALVESNVFRNIYARMMRVGLKAGKLDETMMKIASEHEIESNNSIHRFLNAIEPTIMMSCVLIVGIILLSVMIPLISIMASIGS